MQKYVLVEYSVFGEFDDEIEIEPHTTDIYYSFRRNVFDIPKRKLIQKLKTEKKRFPAYRYFSNYDLRPWLSNKANENTVDVLYEESFIEFYDSKSGKPFGRLELVEE